MTCSCYNTTVIGEVKLMAIKAFELTIDPNQCRLYIDDDSEAATIPCLLIFDFIYKQKNNNEIDFLFLSI